MPELPNSPQMPAGATRAHRPQIKVADCGTFSRFRSFGGIVRRTSPMNHATSRGTAPRLATPTDLGANAAKDIAGALNGILADTYALYLKTKNFHWHISGPHFRDYHLMLDEHADAIFATTDPLAERVRKLSGTTLRSISHISKVQSLKDNNDEFVGPNEMLRELMND